MPNYLFEAGNGRKPTKSPNTNPYTRHPTESNPGRASGVGLWEQIALSKPHGGGAPIFLKNVYMVCKPLLMIEGKKKEGERSGF
jgi:hypothetical protein